ncbi:unnamed protein product, partial [Amoebophrya sp. A25]|eukprot:GSA25T00008068001.1
MGTTICSADPVAAASPKPCKWRFGSGIANAAKSAVSRGNPQVATPVVQRGSTTLATPVVPVAGRSGEQATTFHASNALPSTNTRPSPAYDQSTSHTSLQNQGTATTGEEREPRTTAMVRTTSGFL